MKKVFILLMLSLSCLVVNAQDFDVPQDSSASYPLTEIKSDGKLSWTISRIYCTQKFTYVRIRTTILSNKWGGVVVSPETKLYADKKAYQIRGWLVSEASGNKRYTPGAAYPYYTGNKGNYIDSWLVFPKIPYNIAKVNLELNGLNWMDLAVLNNEDPLTLTDWTEEALRMYWQQNGLQDYEGIYEFAEATNAKWWGEAKPVLALKREGDSFKVIYLADYGKKQSMWKEGHLKAEIRLTAVRDYYRVSWIADNGEVNTNVQVELKDGMFAVKSREANGTAIFVRMFPGASEGSSSGGGMPTSPQSQGSQSYTTQGSGIIIDKSGIVATNYHIVSNKSTCEIVVRDGHTIKTYKTKLLVADRVNDLALLQIEDKDFQTFASLPFTIKSDICETGTSIFSMGYPLSQYMGDEVKITDGIISSITGYQGDVVTYQISAPIQPGSSGGPLFDKKGNLIGITNGGISAAQNVGYAIKSTYLRLLIQSSPVQINTPTTNTLSNLSLSEQIKQLSKFVVIVKAK